MNSITVKTKTQSVTGSHVLVATGRAANIEKLGLEKAHIQTHKKGISVNNRLQTNHKHIYAIGDCIGDLQFTHVAGYHAGIVIRNCLFRLPAKVDLSACPWVTYSDPELAHVGLSYRDIHLHYPDALITEFSFKDNDRAVAEGNTIGKIKVVSNKKGKVLSATIVGKDAGDLIMPWVMAIQNKWGFSKIASLIAPYPTRSEISKRVAGSFYTPKLYGAFTRFVVRFLMKWLP